MIKKIEIYNTFGIKELKLDFEIKNKNINKNDFSVENQIALINEDAFSLIPSLIAKNASGKTSLLRAVKFASNAMDKELFSNMLKTFMKSILFKKLSILNMEINSMEIPGQAKDYLNSDEAVVKDVLHSVFKDVVFQGKDYSVIIVEFANTTFSIETTEHDVTIKQGNGVKPISLQKILMSLVSNSNHILQNVTINQTAKIIDEFVMKEIEKIEFQVKDVLMVNVEEFEKDGLVKSLSQRDSLWNDISLFVDTYGYDAFQTFVKKLDENITKVEFDKSSNQVLFYHADNGNFPINQQKLSFGTAKMINLFAKAISVFKKGGALFIDEVENGLHLSLIKLLVATFSDPVINKHNAQLILTTHNPLLFERGIIFIHNVYMSEKNCFHQIESLCKAKEEFNMYAFVKSKNYYNDLFWLQEDANHKSTLSSASIDLIIYKIVDGHKVN